MVAPCACIHVSMYPFMHVCMYACMHVCMLACMHVCMLACWVGVVWCGGVVWYVHFGVYFGLYIFVCMFQYVYFAP